MTDDSLPDYVRKFLARSGYPLEMRAARMFGRRGFQVEQARVYIDLNTEVLREVDVLAYSTNRTFYPGVGWAELRLVIECKRSDKPWLMFVGDTTFTRSEQHFESLDIIEYGSGKLTEAHSADDMPVISHVGDIAYRIGTAAQRDDAFAALQQVNSAVLGVRRDLVAPAEHQSDPMVVVLVPVIVTDSPLFECRLDSNGEIAPKAVDKGLVLTRLRAEDRLQSVWIVSDKELEGFVDLARRTVDNMKVTA